MYNISPSSLNGIFAVPPSKSQTMRAILFAALASGTSIIEEYLASSDSLAMLEAIQLLGARVEVKQKTLVIQGFGGQPVVPDDVIHCGNSGIVLRFITAIAALFPHYTILTGDASIRHNRPMTPLLNALTQLGAKAISTKQDGFAPLIIQGPLTRSFASLEGGDSQPISALLVAGAISPHPIEIEVLNPGEKPWVDLTLSWLDRLHIDYERIGYERYTLKGGAKISPFTYRVPGDFSSAAFPIVAALLTHSELTLTNLDFDDPQGDKKIIDLLQKMGATFIIDPSKKQLIVKKSERLKGISIDINDCIDALPILSVVGCFAEGKTEIFNGAAARGKESNRISSMKIELEKMGANIQEKSDGLVIYPSRLTGAHLNSHADHRVLFSLSVAALAANGHTTIEGIECASKTIPSFLDDFQTIGANIESHPIRI